MKEVTAISSSTGVPNFPMSSSSIEIGSSEIICRRSLNLDGNSLSNLVGSELPQDLVIRSELTNFLRPGQVGAGVNFVSLLGDNLAGDISMAGIYAISGVAALTTPLDAIASVEFVNHSVNNLNLSIGKVDQDMGDISSSLSEVGYMVGMDTTSYSDSKLVLLGGATMQAIDSTGVVPDATVDMGNMYVTNLVTPSQSDLKNLANVEFINTGGVSGLNELITKTTELGNKITPLETDLGIPDITTSQYLRLSGGIIEGDIDMARQPISGVRRPSNTDLTDLATTTFVMGYGITPWDAPTSFFDYFYIHDYPQIISGTPITILSAMVNGSIPRTRKEDYGSSVRFEGGGEYPIPGFDSKKLYFVFKGIYFVNITIMFTNAVTGEIRMVFNSNSSVRNMVYQNINNSNSVVLFSPVYVPNTVVGNNYIQIISNFSVSMERMMFTGAYLPTDGIYP